MMDASLDEVVGRLTADRGMASAFRSAYGQPIDAANVVDALVSFERSLMTPNARFDRWLKGDADALSAIEIEGYALFNSTGCAFCHQGAAIGANMFQRQGVFRPLVRPPPEVVRVPSLRNIAATAPYFHDGAPRRWRRQCAAWRWRSSMHLSPRRRSMRSSPSSGR